MKKIDEQWQIYTEEDRKKTVKRENKGERRKMVQIDRQGREVKEG